MKETLLSLVQRLLSDMDGDEINSINDTVEAQQIAQVFKGAFYDIISRSDVKELEKPFSLEADGGPSKPTLMTRPAIVDSIKWVKYNKAPVDSTVPMYQDVFYVNPEEFFSRTLSPPEDDNSYGSYSVSVEGTPITIFYKNNKAPEFFTSLDDTTIVFDSFDSEVETNLQKSKTVGFGKLLPTFVMSDSFVPPLDANVFPLLYQEAKAGAFLDLKQVENPRAERKARSQWVQVQRNNNNVGGQKPTYGGPNDRLPNFGRRT